jgi:hypothetical protein
MMKKKSLKIGMSLLFIALVALTSTPLVSADGWHPSAEFLHLYEPAQKAVIHWNGETEVMLLSSAVKSDQLTDIAWVVPIISTTKPVVSAGNMTVFEKLVDFFDDYYWWDNPYRKLGNYDGNGNITVIEVAEIDIYDVIILKATNATDLINWLIENNLMVPEQASEVIDRYVQMDNCYFIINKIDLKNRFKDTIEQIENGTIPENYSEYQRVIDDLRMGLATPLRFEFTPPTLYYPLVISSLNAGEGKIEVYVIAEKPVADKNRVMQVDRCKEITFELKENLSQFFNLNKEKFVTRLSYSGQLSNLTDDAVFEFFTPSDRYNSVFLYIDSDLENLSSQTFIDVLGYYAYGGLIELQYRVDSKGPWMVAERSDMAYIYDSWWKPYQYSVRVNERDSGLWTIELDAENLTTGTHCLEIRILHRCYDNLFYTSVYQNNFTTIEEKTEPKQSSNTTTNNNNNNIIDASLLSGLIVLSFVSIAVISRKTKLGQ